MNPRLDGLLWHPGAPAAHVQRIQQLPIASQSVLYYIKDKERTAAMRGGIAAWACAFKGGRGLALLLRATCWAGGGKACGAAATAAAAAAAACRRMLSSALPAGWARGDMPRGAPGAARALPLGAGAPCAWTPGFSLVRPRTRSGEALRARVTNRDCPTVATATGMGAAAADALDTSLLTGETDLAAACGPAAASGGYAQAGLPP